MPTYITESLQRLIQMKDQDLTQIFDQVKEKLMLNWKNFYVEQSYRQAFSSFESVIVNLSLEKKHLRQHLEGFTF